ncbi:MAG: 4-hydroxythreonine-4-phosphate dehydrogenase PdxA [Bacteroides sp.]
MWSRCVVEKINSYYLCLEQVRCVTMLDGKVVVGITQGDCNGIGVEILIRSLLDSMFVEQFVPVIYGSGRVLAYYRKALNIQGLQVFAVKNAAEAHPRRINLVEVANPEPVMVEMGQPSRLAGQLAFLALEHFFADWRQGSVDALVTLPVNKSTMQSAEFVFPGHTEYLADRTNSESALMLMLSDRLRVGVVTGHVPLRRVSELLSSERILEKVRQLHQTLRRDFEIERPRIAILGINPHAGEGGMLGTEEMSILAPAIEQANREGMIVVGALSADGFFGSGAWKHYDAVLAMYHDQGLVPFKTIAFDGGVNYTAGLPLVRTSPAHGTAYGLVGKLEASCEPFRQAVYAAIQIYKARLRTDTTLANALRPDELPLVGENTEH